MTVSRIVSRDEATRIFGDGNLYPAGQCIIDDKGGTPLNLHRRLAPKMSRQLKFISPRGKPKGLYFASATRLYAQATRGVRELTAESAALLDRIIVITDQLPRSQQVITVTEEMLQKSWTRICQEIGRLPEEIPSRSRHVEGSVQRILVNRYERDPCARRECIRSYGTACAICGFDFVGTYGNVMDGFIHVHHVKPLSTVGDDYEVDAVRDLVPVCPNCHAVLHYREPPYSVNEVRQFLRDQRNRE
jgi:5-methylcytosine-specific restriction endonuclease McrA